MSKILIISPHPDDGILGMGGSIAKFIGEKAEIKYLILSWNGQGFNKEEIKNSLKILGIDEAHTIMLNYEVRNFPYFSSAIRQEFINIRENFKPDIVFCHNSFDFHQDHQISTQEALRAFREGNLMGYTLPWNVREFRFDSFVGLTKDNLQKKLEAAKALISQQFRFYYMPERIKAWAIAAGLFRRKEYAEVFENISQNL